MKKDTFIYSFGVTGLGRKQVAAIIAEALGEQVKYAGPSSFSYQVGSWTIDRNCLVTTPELATIELELLRKVLDALKNARVLAKGDSKVTFSMDGHNGASLRNVVNLIWRKQKVTGNDKYSLRVWLIRLGFVGSEYKMDRKILLSKLTGDGAFRTAGSEIVIKIEKLRADLVRIKEGKAYTDPEVIRASQELDRALDVYQELMLKKTDKE